MDPANLPTQSLPELLSAITGLINQYITAHPGVYDNVVGGIVLAILLLLFPLVQKRAADRFWQAAGWLGSKRGFSKLALGAYRRELVNQYGTLVNIYLEEKGKPPEKLSLHQVFVSLTLLESGKTELRENRSTKQILTDNLQKRLVILGAPGSGKSTLLKALVTGVSRSEWPQFTNLQPVLIPLREYGRAADKKSLLDWLAEDELPQFGLRNPKPLLKSLLAQGRVLLLLDGLDEVTNDRVDIVNSAISKFLDDLDKAQACRVLLTCREQNYDDLSDRYHYTRKGFVEYRVADLREAELREFVRRRQDSFNEKRKSMENYLEQVFRHSDILQLHRNPLLLTLSMGVYLHRVGEEVPHNLAQFYEQSMNNLLCRHDFREVGGTRINLIDADDKFLLLRQFARQNLIEATEQKRDFETFEFKALAKLARQMVREGKVDFKQQSVHDVVKEIQMHSGLLNATRDNEYFLFAHRSLNEYCAAAALNRQNDEGFKLIAEQLGNPAWRQVIIFYAAIDDDNNNAVKLVAAIKQLAVEESDIFLLALAGHCAAVLKQPRIPLRLELLDALTAALWAADVATRPVLLKSLLALGNSRDEAIRQRLDSVMRQFVESGRVEELLRDVVERLEATAALQFLAYLAESGDLGRKRMAVWGLAQLQHLDTIPLLWRLLLDFRAVDETDSERLAIKPLLALMEEPGAVECLNACEPKPVAPDKTMQQKLLEIYPFQSADQSIVNFAWLLAWTSKVGFSSNSMGETGSAWRQFVDLIMSEKNTEELRDWKRLPRDKNKRTVIVPMVVLGRWLFWFPLAMSFVLIYIMFLLGTHIGDNIFLGIALNIILCIVLLLIWRVWKYTLTRWGWLGALEAFPPRIKRWLLGNRSLDTSLFRRMLQGISLNLKRAYFFGWAILLLAPAEFLKNPSISGHERSIESLTTNHSSQILLTNSYDKTVRLLDSKTGIQLRRFDHNSYIRDMALAQDGKTVLTGLTDGTARLWDSNTGTQLLRLQHDDGVLSKDVDAVAFSPDGATLLTGSYDKTARLWDSKTGTELLRLKHDDSVYRVAFAPDGSKVLTVSDYAVILWDSKTGNELWRLKHDKSGVKAIFSPDGLSFLTASSDNAAKLWDSKTGTELLRFQHEDIVSDAVFSPDGSSVLTASQDSTTRLWDSKTGIELWRIKHDDFGYDYNVDFAPDGLTVLTLSTKTNKEVWLWYSKTGKELQHFRFSNYIGAVIFTINGHGIYTGSGDGIVRLWNTRTGELIWQTPTPFWNDTTWTIRVFYIWLALVFMVFFLPCLNWFDRGKVWYLRKSNRYIQLYQIPGVEHWLPPEEKNKVP